jgi:hypothetical protein
VAFHATLLTNHEESKRASLLLGAGVALLALVSLLIAADGARTFAAAWGGPRVVLRTGAAAALPAAVILAALGVMLLRGAAGREAQGSDARLFRIALAASPLLILLPLLCWIAADMSLTRQGYARCLSEPGARFLTLVWARPPAACRMRSASA